MGFVGDLFRPEARSLPSTIVTAAMGVGILIGQVLSGLLGPTYGWRMIFAIVSLPGFLVSFLTLYLTKEPARGGTEVVLADHFRKGGSYQKKLSFETFLKALKIRT